MNISVKNVPREVFPSFQEKQPAAGNTSNALKEPLISLLFLPYNLKIAFPHPIF